METERRYGLLQERKTVLQQFLCVVDGYFKISISILCDHRRNVDEKAYVDGCDRGICCNDPFIWPFS